MKKLSKSIRKFIRIKKAGIRQEGLNVADHKKRIQELYQKFSKNSINKLKI